MRSCPLVLLLSRRSSSFLELNQRRHNGTATVNQSVLHLAAYKFVCSNQQRSFSTSSARPTGGRKQESYFSAIGLESEEPPLHLSRTQVTQILRTNETLIQLTPNLPVNKLECNQLAANHPIEDRLRVSLLNFDLEPSIESRREVVKDDRYGPIPRKALLLSVLDGHGGVTCADVVQRRLFTYIGLSLASALDIKLPDVDFRSIVEKITIDMHKSESMLLQDHPQFDGRIARALYEQELIHWETFQKDLTPEKDYVDAGGDVDLLIERAITRAFQRCDDDLSEEISNNLTSIVPPSRHFRHFYRSAAVSGCCATIAVIFDNGTTFVASSGDCRAVLGKSTRGTAIDLNEEHNGDNLDELKRLYSAHPKLEQNKIIRNNRLLGQLMPLRAFGDFNYKWTVDRIRRAGLLSAFGSHVIPPNYITPPYLIVEPTVRKMIISPEDKFIVLATDGLWEQFDTSRDVVAQLFVTPHEADCDQNCATHLIRRALATSPVPHDPADEEQIHLMEHDRLVSFLTLPETVVRNFRDDISLIVAHLQTSERR